MLRGPGRDRGRAGPCQIRRFSLGAIGVDIFFVVSGFVHGPYESAASGRLGQFLADRAWPNLPALLGQSPCRGSCSPFQVGAIGPFLALNSILALASLVRDQLLIHRGQLDPGL